MKGRRGFIATALGVLAAPFLSKVELVPTPVVRRGLPPIEWRKLNEGVTPPWNTARYQRLAERLYGKDGRSGKPLGERM